MATIYDLFELTGLAPNTTYSHTAGTLLGVVDGATSSALDDGEFDVGDALTIGGVTYTINAIKEPDSNGYFTLSSGGNVGFSAGSESNLQVVFLTVSNGTTTRHFAVPNDSFGNFRIQSLTTGNLANVGGNDAAVISTTNNATGVDCFVAGTMIATPLGQIPIEEVKAGDLVLTRDHGPQPVRLCLTRSLDLKTAPARLRPIAIEAGALGLGRPRMRLCISPQHRLLVADVLGRTALVPARALLGRRGVRVMQGLRRVRYVHLVFAQHELIFANGTISESFYPGPVAMENLSPAARAEVLEIFGEAALKLAAPLMRVKAAQPMALSLA